MNKEAEHEEKISDWLNLGARALSENDLEEANLLYHYLKKEYEPMHDSTKHLYKKILDFYQELTSLSEKK
jgi:hypothetical protein